eukprot:TRINITY_DN23843_c0_g1_i1.p3 TRINITY_DN23843_c0_g1~~TRINITY_DN23843_c0_g1_i1.p3  ORF type:complete len:200 (+),score=50.65 TRINITY_DN23843_c0_g1_i1:70-669(+)
MAPEHRRLRILAQQLCAAAKADGGEAPGVYALEGKRPTVSEEVWIAPNAAVIGDVSLGRGASVWFGATIRGDNGQITVGEGSNVQDGSVLHSDPGSPLTIGKNVTVGHMAMLHGCTVGDESLVGIGAVILNGAKVGKNCIIGAKSLVPEGKVIPDGSLVMGSPAKVVKQVSPDQMAMNVANAKLYERNAERFRAGLRRA